MINKNSPIPIYYQLEELIKDQIEKGDLRPGDTIPPEREYAETYQISRMTVRQAFTKLVNDGYLYRLQGKGTFVAERKVEQELQGLTSFTEDMKTRGMEPSSQLIHFEIIPAPVRIAKFLSIAESSPVYEIKRIRLADQVPMAFETTYISADKVRGLTKEIVNRSLYEYIEGTLGFRIAHAKQIIESSVANKKESEYLSIKEGAPIMVIQRNTYLEDDTPIEVVNSSYRADRYKFIIDMKR